MPDILHRISIDAPAADVHELIATTDGIARWWTGQPLDGSTAIGGEFGLFFGDHAGKPAAVMRVRTDTPEEITWCCEQGPDSWVGTTVTFAIRPNGEDRTTLLFTHAGWTEASEFMHGCSTNWGAYLTSLKTGAETGRFAAFPNGEISRWD